MRLKLKPLEQRLVAVTLALASVVLGYLLLVHWWFTAPLSVMNEEARTLDETYQHYQVLLAQRAPLEKQLANVQAQGLAAQTLLSGNDSGAAGAQLMGLLASYVQETAINGHSCSISNRMPVNGNSDNGFSAVKINVNLDCESEPLARLLYRLETGHPTLIVESMSLRKLDNSTTNGRHHINVQMLITGYLRTAASTEVQQ
ncbi:type II secretion system protein GspM [Pseudomonas sp. dw_358]|uniref:type II secretion system protein GspM n=1 Tax=Pseudomonas sp. dw_358 TaxID=2720083 RepID=UPI001BD5AA96|nr:type II secretion system protein GspM [Pseudomonas sp. dw_358]